MLMNIPPCQRHGNYTIAPSVVVPTNLVRKEDKSVKTFHDIRLMIEQMSRS